MRKIGIFMAACALLMSAVAFAADAPAVGDGHLKGHMAIGVMGGIAMPMGALAEDLDFEAEGTTGFQGDMGFGGGLCFDYFIVDNFALGLDGSYATFGSGAEDAGDVKATTMQFGVHGKYMIPTGGPVVPYLFAGGGMYMAKITDVPESTEDLSQNKIGLNGGVGVEYKVSEMVAIGLNGAYHYALGKFEPEVEGETVEVLKDWNYVSFNAAVTFHLPMK